MGGILSARPGPMILMILVFALAFLGARVPLAAQTHRPAFEVYMTVGMGSGEFTSEALGGGRAQGLSAGLGVGMRPRSSTDRSVLLGLGLEFEVNTIRTVRYSGQPGLVAGPHTDTYVTGSILAHFGNERVEGFGLLGAGKRFVSGRDDLVLQLGGGAKVFLTRSVFLRPEFRLLPEWSSTTWRLSTGLAYRW